MQLFKKPDENPYLGGLHPKIVKACNGIYQRYAFLEAFGGELDRFCISYALAARDFLFPYMRDQHIFKAEMGRSAYSLGEGNESHVVDQVGGEILAILLWDLVNKSEFKDWAVFDEEQESFRVIGVSAKKKKVIIDPFDNTTFAVTGHRDCSVAICIADEENKFVNCCVADLQTDAVYFADCDKSMVMYIVDNQIKAQFELRTAAKMDVNESYCVIPHFRPPRRIAFATSGLFEENFSTFNMGGPLTIGRLADGIDSEVHAYLDFAEGFGQPIYEILYFPIAIKAGAYVTDIDGVEFKFEYLLRMLEENSKARYRFVAACTKQLHAALMQKISESVKSNKKKRR